MKLTCCFIDIDKEYKANTEIGLKRLIDTYSAVGFDGIDFNVGMPEYCSGTYGADFYKNIKCYADDKGICFDQTHVPYPTVFPDESKNTFRFEQMVTCIEHSALLGARFVVIHPCCQMDYVKGNNREYIMDYNYKFFKKLAPHAENCGVKLAIENVGNYRGHAVTETAEGLIELLDMLDSDVFVACYDSGHSNCLTDDPIGMLTKLGDRIACTHIHDNDCTVDQHLLPYYGKLDFEKTMEALANTGYNGNLNYEARNFATRVPMELRVEALKYMVGVGHYLIDRFNYYRGKQNG